MIEAYYKRLTDPDPASASARRRGLEHLGRHDAVADRGSGPHQKLRQSGLRARVSRASNATTSSIAAFSPATASCWSRRTASLQIPGTIVHGRYDVVTPAKNAWDLKKVWPRAELRIVPDSGHAMTEPGIVHELIAATRAYAR